MFYAVFLYKMLASSIFMFTFATSSTETIEFKNNHIRNPREFEW